ncbi:hypothetical protein [Salinibacter ruber]|uniref:hypothetical protein n=1 Tax=Salinibacter ruber TaxID=146919 RepID=UPI002167D8B8|nr:hypothetical protein [Salinibacter ruber]MCS4198134.1 putative aspartyl protease [Salinibacter ruber]
MVPVTVHSGNGDERTIESLIDTGFNGGRAVPAHHIEALGLSRIGRERMRLASGDLRFAGTCRAVVEMAEKRYSVRVIEAGEPLIGMALLWANDPNVQCVEGGHLAVETHFVEE